MQEEKIRTLAAQLREADIGIVKEQEPLSRHTTWRVGGPAELFIVPSGITALAEAMRLIHASSLPWRVLGRGSNLLVRDGGIRGVTISTAHIQHHKFEGETVAAGAGFSLVRLAVLAAQKGLSGLEFAGGIPGSVGGAVFMNAGAHGSDVSRVLEKAEVLLPDGTLQVMQPADFKFAYRTSVLQGECPGIVCEATFRLKAADRQAVMATMQQYRKKRLATQPLNLPCAGSVFRNPPGDYAARLIEASGLKGMRIGGAQISEQHANFIVNLGQATARDVLALIEHARQTVWEKFGVALKTEVEIAGEE